MIYYNLRRKTEKVAAGESGFKILVIF